MSIYKSYSNNLIRDKLIKYFYPEDRFVKDVEDYESKEVAMRVFKTYISDTIKSDGILPKEIIPLYFRQEPSELLKAVTRYDDRVYMQFPLFNENGEIIKSITLDGTNKKIIYIDVPEEVFLEYPVTCNDLLTNKFNAALEDKVVETLETETNSINLGTDLSDITNGNDYGTSFPGDLFRISISRAIKTLNKLAKRNVSIVVPSEIKSLLPSEILNNYKVYAAACNNIYVGDLSTVILTYKVSKIEKDKQVGNGCYTLAVTAHNFNGSRTYEKGICKILL